MADVFDRILKVLRNRYGFTHWWHSVDEPMRKEIGEEVVAAAAEHLQEFSCGHIMRKIRRGDGSFQTYVRCGICLLSEQAAQAHREQLALLKEERDKWKKVAAVELRASQENNARRCDADARLSQMREVLKEIKDELSGICIDGVDVWNHWLERPVRERAETLLRTGTANVEPLLVKCPHCEKPILRSRLQAGPPIFDGHTGPAMGYPNAEEVKRG